MTTDEKVRLAQQIAGQLIGVTPSEWSKWCSYATRNGLKRALQLAKYLQNSPSLRRGPQQSYRSISQVMRRFQEILKSLSQDELAEVLGYARQWLFARRGMSYAERTRR